MALAGADTVTLDPAAVAADRTALALTGAYSIYEADYGNAEVEQFLSERSLGDVPTAHRIPNRTVEFGLRIQASGTVGIGAAIRNLQRKVARFQDEGGWLGRTLSPRSAGEFGTDVLYADVVDAALALPVDWYAQRQEAYLDARLTLACLPDFYGAEVAAGSANSSGDHDSISLLGTISGDYPARSRYTITESGTVGRQTVVIASQARTYSATSTAALAYEAEAMTAIDGAAAAAVTGAHGGTAVRSTTVSPTWTGIVRTSTGGNYFTHWGNYRLFARCYASADAEVRFEYAVGDTTARRVNDSASIRGDSMFYVRDLGEVRIPKVPTGTQKWEGRIFARSESSGVTVGVDKVWLAPLESYSLVQARRDPSYFPLVDSYAARDSFSQTTGAATGKTLDVGGTWAGAGDSTDGTIGSGVLTRNATGDTPTGRYFTPGSMTSATDTVTSVEFEVATLNANPGYGYVGLLARYGSSTSYAMLKLALPGVDELQTQLTVVTNTGGGDGVISSWYEGKFVTGRRYVLAFAVLRSGMWSAWFYEKAAGVPASPNAVGYNSALVTGGSLASGKAGIYDESNGSGVGVRTYDNFYAYAPPTDGAVLSLRQLSARFNGAWRQSENDQIWTPTHLLGNFPRDPVAGMEARTTRTLILPSAGDTDDQPDLDPVAFTVTRDYSPAYLFVPEA